MGFHIDLFSAQLFVQHLIPCDETDHNSRSGRERMGCITGAPQGIFAANSFLSPNYLISLIHKVLSPSLPPEFFDLRKKAASIRRPFYAQTTTLILECRQVAQFFNTHPTDDNLKVLQTYVSRHHELRGCRHTNVAYVRSALKSAVLALEASIQAVTGNRAFNATADVSKKAVKQFEIAQKDLETCFSTYKVS